MVTSVSSKSIQSGYKTYYIFWHGLVTKELKFLKDNEWKRSVRKS